MEIYVKKHVSYTNHKLTPTKESMSKLHWLNSLPTKYKDSILNQILACDEELSDQKQYKIVVDILQGSQPAPSASPQKRDFTAFKKELPNSGKSKSRVERRKDALNKSRLGGANANLLELEGSLSQNKQMLDEVQSQVREKRMQLLRQAAIPAEAKRSLSPARHKSVEAKFRYPPPNVRRQPDFSPPTHFSMDMSIRELLALESQLTGTLKNAIMML